MKNEIKVLFEEISAIPDIEARKKIIFEDLKSENPKFKKLADSNPKQFLGDVFEIDDSKIYDSFNKLGVNDVEEEINFDDI
jgi:hypothetical protein